VVYCQQLFLLSAHVVHRPVKVKDGPCCSGVVLKIGVDIVIVYGPVWPRFVNYHRRFVLRQAGHQMASAVSGVNGCNGVPDEIVDWCRKAIECDTLGPYPGIA
jgi:hypothetical protein